MENGSIIHPTSRSLGPTLGQDRGLWRDVDIQGQPSVDWPSQKPLWLVELLLPIW